jgi:ribosomal protein S18 acetylase RimI-like enzyme
MTMVDVDFAYSLTDREKWGYLKEDFHWLMAYEPDGCFVAYFNDHPAGIITSTTYDDFAFLGTLIVPDEFRSRKIGERLTLHAMEYLKGRQVKTIELDGVIPAVSLYRRLGFRDKYLSLRFCRPPENKSDSENVQADKKIDTIIDFDAEVTGLNRQRMLRQYIEQMPSNIILEYNNNITGYAIVRLRDNGQYAIGPMVATEPEAAENLMRRIVGAFGRFGLGIGIPMTNSKAIVMARKSGFLYGQPSLRMYQGIEINYEAGIYGIFSAEKG